MSQDRYIAALEISSSKIIGAVAHVCTNNKLEIIAVEQEKAVDIVRYGIIRNLEACAVRIDRIIDRLEKRPSVSPRKINGVFVGISGRGMHSVVKEVSIPLPANAEVTEDIIKRLAEQARKANIESGVEVIDVVPRSYHVDDIETRDPKGMVGSRISATFDLIVCRPEMRSNIERTIEGKLNRHIDGIVVTPLATSHLVLSEEQRRLGCMLVDMGAETTTVNIYRNGAMTYFATLPMGSRNITRDLTSMSILEEQAENIKISTGNAIPASADKTTSLNLHGIRLTDILSTIAARSEEIMANIYEQATYAGVELSNLPAGIIALGGGFRMSGMIELANKSLPASRAGIPPIIDIQVTNTPQAELVQITAILYAAATLTDISSLKMPETHELPATGTPNSTTEPEPEPQKPKKPGKLKKWISTFFGPGEEEEDDLY